MSDIVKSVGESDFKAIVLDASRPVLVDFWAVSCGPCRMIAPFIDELAEEYKGRMDFTKLNVDEAPKIASTYAVMSIPRLIVFKDGKPFEQMTGFHSKKDIQKMLNKVLGI